jgi:microcystin-dependent protein
MDSKYIGEIILFAGSYTPEDFMDCDGREISIQEHQALYSVIGHVFGGDGHKNFKLPDLRGRLPVGFDAKTYPVGKSGGVEPSAQTITIKPENLPAHTHLVQARTTATLTVSKKTGDSKDADGNVLAAGTTSGGDNALVYATPANDSAPAGTLGGVNVTVAATAESTGGGEALPIKLQREPYLAIRYIICVRGEYPPRAD